MKLIFRNSQNIEKQITEIYSVEEIQPAIKQFLDEHNFKSYYTRIMPDIDNPNRIIFDVGSHTELIIADGISFDEYINLTKKGDN